LPGAKEPRLRFANACKGKVDGVKLDLLITPVSDEPPASLSAGQYQNYGRISLQSGEHVELNFALMMSGTVHPQMVDSVIFSVLDLDKRPRSDHHSRFVVKNYEQFRLTKETHMEHIEAGDDTVFTSSDDSLLEELRSPPNKPMELNGEERKRTSSFLFNKVSGFTVELRVMGEKTNTNRAFYMAGPTLLMDSCV